MKIRKLILPLSVFIVMNMIALVGHAGGFGLGLLLFGPTSISVQNYFESNRSIDGAFGWDFNRNNELYLHSTYLLHRPNQFHIENYFFNLFYGAGAYIHNSRPSSNFGARFVVGSAYNVKTIPIEAFAEISANLNLVPNTEVTMLVGLGGRYYF
jgi:hypothetical protein